MNKNYAVKHKETGLFFSDFDANNQPIWADENQAKRFDKSGARGQALLFACHDIKVQQKPVSI